MQFIVDENVRKEILNFLKAEGHDILTPTPASEDEEIARRAQETKRIILTHDQHFADIILFPPEKYSGIIRIKIHPPNPAIIIKALSDFLLKVSAQELKQRLVILEEEGFRIR